MSASPQKSLEAIGNALQRQYERWQPRARYKHLLDPTTDEVRKLCTALRKNAKVYVCVYTIDLQILAGTYFSIFEITMYFN